MAITRLGFCGPLGNVTIAAKATGASGGGLLPLLGAGCWWWWMILIGGSR